MGRQIILNGEKRKQIEKDFKVCRTTLWAALNFRTNGPQANMLRAVAKERGGVEIMRNGDFEPNIKLDTYWDEVPHRMVQVFSERVKLMVYVENSTATIIADGKLVKEFSNVMMSQLPVLQAQAQEIVNDLR